MYVYPRVVFSQVMGNNPGELKTEKPKTFTLIHVRECANRLCLFLCIHYLVLPSHFWLSLASAFSFGKFLKKMLYPKEENVLLIHVSRRKRGKI